VDYKELAAEFMQKLHILNKARPHKRISESMHGEAFVLKYLSYQDGFVLPSEISNIMGISSARIAAALNSLERKGLITRQIDPSDRRRILVELTSEGKALAESQHQEILENTTKMFAFLGEHDAREYVRITGRLAEYVSQCKEMK